MGAELKKIEKSKGGQPKKNRYPEGIGSFERMGAELKKIDKAKGGGDNRKKHPSREGRGAPEFSDENANVSIVPTLKQLGVSYKQSAQAQALADISDDLFEGVISHLKEGPEMSTKAVAEVASAVPLSQFRQLTKYSVNGQN